MRPRLLPALGASLALLAAAASCGEGPRRTAYERETLRAGSALLRAFVADLDAGRTEAALARTSADFRAAAPVAAAREVHAARAAVLGRAVAWSEPDLEKPVPAGAAEAVLAADVRFEQGTGRVRARLVRPATGAQPWVLDAFEVRGRAFTWTLRPVGR